ncbi:MAG: IS66 family transposase [bacterium]
MGKRYTEREVEQIVADAVQPLLQRIVQLEAKLAQYETDSSNSSKPPSSDIVKPPPKPEPKSRKKRKRGGQVGHRKFQRQPFPAEQVDRTYTYELEDTTGLQPLSGTDGWRIVQQVELPARFWHVTEHRARRYRCRRTGRIVTAPLPRDVTRGGLMGPRLTTLACYLKGVCHSSYRTVQRFFREVMELDLSTGLLAKATRRMTAALSEPYEQLRAALPRQPALGIDETGLRHAGRGHWVWCTHAPGEDGLTVYAIDPSRGSGVLERMLGPDYTGTITCDYFSAYRKYLADSDAVTMQFCWAHLVREVKFMAGLPDKVTANFGGRLLKLIRQLFALIHRRDRMTPAGHTRALHRLRQRIVALIRRAPPRDEPRKLKQRFRAHGDAYFTFIDHGGIEPTNNATERQIRFVVLDRKVTQGTKGLIGNQWCQRIWSTIATCRQRGRPIFAFLLEALHAQLHDRPPPSLVEV